MIDVKGTHRKELATHDCRKEDEEAVQEKQKELQKESQKEGTVDDSLMAAVAKETSTLMAVRKPCTWDRHSSMEQSSKGDEMEHHLRKKTRRCCTRFTRMRL